jgi:hypothetical protein
VWFCGRRGQQKQAAQRIRAHGRYISSLRYSYASPNRFRAIG